MDIVLLTGDYKKRQEKANQLKADLYLELHLNASDNAAATGVETWIGTNHSQTSKRTAANIGQYIAARTKLTLRHDGVPQIGGRANGSVVHTNMPAVLTEFCFGTNPRDLAVIKADIPNVADALLDAVEFSLPGIKLLALSVGHVGKAPSPKDRGAALANKQGYEADITLQIAAEMVNQSADPTARIPD